MKRISTLRRAFFVPVALAAGISLTAHESASAQEEFTACYVPQVGAVYLIKRFGLPQECYSPSHEEVSWVEGAGGPLTDGSVGSAALADRAVTSAKLAPGSVTADKLADGAISGVAAGSIGSTELADGAVTATKLAPRSVTIDKLADGAIPGVTAGSIGSSELADGAVTREKIANDAVGQTQLQPRAVLSVHIGPSQIKSVNVGPRQIQDEHIATGIDGSKVRIRYERASGESVSFTRSQQLEIQCPTGTRVVAGGHRSQSGIAYAASSFPVNDSVWRLVLRTLISTASATVRPFAVCAQIG